MNREDRAILVVIDGWGVRSEKKGNAIAKALTPNYSRYLGQYPNGTLEASGLPVGLPAGVMGNSEVGHMNIGSGRRVVQDQVRIHEAIDSGDLFSNRVLKETMAKARNGKLHLMGLVSQGNVHSAERHYLTLISMAHKEGISPDRLFVHAFLDGRDTSPKSAEEYLKNLENILSQEGGKIATVSGRFFAMDRDKRWERTEQAYRALVLGEGQKARSALEALHAAYDRGETDEFVQPTVIVGSGGTIQDGDAVICFNFRPDRMRQIVRALKNWDVPIGSLRKDLEVSICTFTQYDQTFDLPVAFPPMKLTLVAGEVLANEGRHQFRTAETEKYAHVTYFFNGGREEPFSGEERLLVPSPKVRTYDLQPEMSSRGVTDAVLDRVQKKDDTLIVVNFAHPDMVGHTGVFDAAVAAVESTDRCIGEIVEVALAKNRMVFITADHGNVEMMVDPATGKPHTAHTTNPVPLICIGPFQGYRLRPKGALCDVMPTVFSALEVPQPAAMSGKNLLVR